MAERESPALRALRRMWGDEFVDELKSLMDGPSKINSAASDRAEHERQRKVDAEKLRQAEEDEQRRFPDK